ncbi:MAG TPA: hypothetical protein DCL77_01285 [Prolixibacteraceae bacterium]|jgi:hypothetical protein|nr:hypothetical protein [Prolixibacteraceae bacterium]
MKQWIGIVLFMVFVTSMTSCYNTTLPKPDKLISKNKFVKMMVDIYLVQGINNGLSSKNELKKLTQTDLYYSVLKKYSVPDTVFIRSLIYYSSFPKEYEKMHVEIMDILNQSELQIKPQQKLDLKTK